MMIPKHCLMLVALTAVSIVVAMSCIGRAEERLVSTAKTRVLPDQVTFNAHIRPLMSNTCFVCHGPDKADNESGYRIDSFESAIASLPSDETLVGIKPLDPMSSEVYRRIMGQGDRLQNSLDQAVSAGATDRPTAALLSDLKNRGLLEDTLVLWGGEFGRTPMAQGSGRDHHINAFSLWMAGGGVKGGMTYGATDELGYRSVENVVSVHDLHATMLHLFGIEHEKLSARFQGLDLRLTGVDPSRVVREIIA